MTEFGEVTRVTEIVIYNDYINIIETVRSLEKIEDISNFTDLLH